MNEVYHPDGTPTGPRRPFAEWDLEIERTPTGYRWHTCNGITLAAAGVARTRLGARAAARLFTFTSRWHRPRTDHGQHLVITFKSGTQVRVPATVYQVRTNPLTGALTRLGLDNNATTTRVSLDFLDPRQVAAIHHEPAAQGG